MTNLPRVENEFALITIVYVDLFERSINAMKPKGNLHSIDCRTVLRRVIKNAFRGSCKQGCQIFHTLYCSK